MEAFRVHVRYLDDIDVAAFLLPPDETGRYGLRLNSALAGGERRFWMLHDLAHVIAGEADELTWEDFDDPYPHFERRADLFAARGVIHARERLLPPELLEQVIWREVPSAAKSWKYRVPEIAKALSAPVDDTVDEWLD